MLKAVREFMALASEVLGPRTTVQQMQVADFIWQAGERGTTAAEVAEAFDISHATATRHIARWVADGQIRITEDLDDKRIVRYWLADTSKADLFNAWASQYRVTRIDENAPPE